MQATCAHSQEKQSTIRYGIMAVLRTVEAPSALLYGSSITTLGWPQVLQ
jgi:hypothetical protein